MERKILSGITLMLLFVGMLTLAFETQLVRAEPRTWIVDDDGPADFHTIQEAINAANPGDTIYVKAGTYYERADPYAYLVVNKTLSLVGENSQTTIIDGSGGYSGKNVVSVRSNNVNITNFMIRNISAYFNPGIMLADVSHCRIANNIITENTNQVYGIMLWNSHNNTISGNNITANGGFGIWLEENSSGNTISNNSITNNWAGITLVESYGNTVTGNNITDNMDGIELLASSGNTLSNNNINNSRYNLGVRGLYGAEGSLSIYINDIAASNFVDGKPVYYLVNQKGLTVNPSTFPNIGYLALINSTNITVENLTLTKNVQGILFAYTCNSTIRNCNTANNWNGIWLDSSSNNTLYGNSVTDNYYGVYPLFSSSNNVIYHNNFINNFFQVFEFRTGANTWDDGYPSGGNYWSDYEERYPSAVELDSSGIWDTPYFINTDNQDYYPFMYASGPPRANFAWIPEYAVVNETIGFSAFASYDRGGFIASYEWDFGDGNVTTVADPIITHVYTAPGIYPVNLTVTDNDGLTDSIIKSITLKKESSIITVNVDPATVPVGSNVTINGTITPIRVDVNVTISYRPLGGTWTTLATVKTDSSSQYTYAWKTADEGIYEIEGSWQGDENTWSAESEMKIVTVDSTPPTIGIPSRTPEDDVLPGQAVKISVDVTDALSQVKNVTLSYTINDEPTWTNLPMNYSSSTGLYEATIPPQEPETWVKYKITAYDYAGNNATLDGTEPYCTYQVIPEFPPTTILPLFIILSIVTVIFVKLKKKKQIIS